MGRKARFKKARKDAARGYVRHKRPMKTKVMSRLERLIDMNVIQTKHQLEEMIALGPEGHREQIRALLMRKLGKGRYDLLPCCGHAQLSRVETQGRNIVHGPRCPERDRMVILSDSPDGGVQQLRTVEEVILNNMPKVDPVTREVVGHEDRTFKVTP